jgi:phosphate:Na+ symporter
VASFVVLVQLLGAVVLLVWALGHVSAGLDRAFGGRMRLILALGTKTRVSAFGIGLGVTLVLQSSTATALVASTYVGQGLIDLTMAQAVMLGADVGTSLVAQVLSLRITWLSAALILVGGATLRFTEANRPRGIARAMIGLGLMLLSLRLVGEATAPLRDNPAIIQFLRLLGDAPLFAVATAAVLAAGAASSLAIVLLVMTFAGSIDPALTVLFVAGANLGSAVPPLVAASGDPAARQVMLGNLIVRAAGALAVTLVVPFFGEALLNLERALDIGPRLAVDAHVAFNLALALIFLPLTGPTAALVRRLSPVPEQTVDGPKHLAPAALAAPATALAAAARETLRVGDTVERMLEVSLAALRTDDERLCDAVRQMDDKVDRLQEAIKLFIAKLGRDNLSDEELKFSTAILSYAINLEHIGDIVEKNLNKLALKKITNHLAFSSEGFGEIERLYLRTIENLHLAQTVFMVRDARLARKLVESKIDIRHMEDTSSAAHLRRFQEGRPESLMTSSLHLDILRDLKRINAHIASVAYPILDEIGALRESRLRAE